MLSSRAFLVTVGWLLSFPSFGLVGGYPVYTGQFPSVFMITGQDEVLGEGYCTAAKVAPEWILTAAHCVDHRYRNHHQHRMTMKFDIKPGQRMQYTFATDNVKGGETLNVLEVKLPSAMMPDVALIRVVPDGTFARAPMAPVSRAFVPANLYIDLVGYGAEGDADIAKRPARLTFHGAVVSTTEHLTSEVMKLGTKQEEVPPVLHFFGVINWPHLAGHTNLGGGDSGGPVFISGTHTIVGVNSEAHCPTENPDCEVTNNSWFARLNQLPSDWWPFEIRCR